MGFACRVIQQCGIISTGLGKTTQEETSKPLQAVGQSGGAESSGPSTKDCGVDFVTNQLSWKTVI